MDFDDIDTDTVVTNEGELSQLVEMLSGHSSITTEELVITTESGEKLQITSEAGYSSIQIEIVYGGVLDD